jgi:hypothetical protein
LGNTKSGTILYAINRNIVICNGKVVNLFAKTLKTLINGTSEKRLAVDVIASSAPTIISNEKRPREPLKLYWANILILAKNCVTQHVYARH